MSNRLIDIELPKYNCARNGCNSHSFIIDLRHKSIICQICARVTSITEDDLTNILMENFSLLLEPSIERRMKIQNEYSDLINKMILYRIYESKLF